MPPARNDCPFFSNNDKDDKDEDSLHGVHRFQKAHDVPSSRGVERDYLEYPREDDYDVK